MASRPSLSRFRSTSTLAADVPATSFVAATSLPTAFTVPEGVLKGQAKRLLDEIRPYDSSFTLSKAQAMLARVWHAEDWHALMAQRVRRQATLDATPWSLENLGAKGLSQLFDRWIDLDEANGMWRGRAVALVENLLNALFWLRDHQGLNLDLRENLNTLRDHLLLDNLRKMVAQRPLPWDILQPLRSYLLSLPRFEHTLPDGRSDAVTLEQHHFVLMQLVQMFHDMQAVLPLAGLVVWRQSWKAADDHKQGDQAGRFTWLDSSDAYPIRSTSFHTTTSLSVVRVQDWLERMALTLSSNEAAVLKHWLKQVPNPMFVKTAERLDRELSPRPH